MSERSGVQKLIKDLLSAQKVPNGIAKADLIWAIYFGNTIGSGVRSEEFTPQ